MNMRKVISLFTTAIAAAAFVLFVPGTSDAQGRYANRYSRGDVSGIISRLETSSDEFRRDFDRAMDNSNINGTRDEERFNNIVRDFENSVDRLRRQFDRSNNWWESRNDVQAMVRDASPVNSMMNTLSFRRNLERQWSRLRNDINAVADTYDLPGLNGGGWNGGGNWPGNGNGGWNGGGGQAITPPSWAQGTFYSDYPNVRMTISRSGDVESMMDGTTYRGRYTRNGIWSEGALTTVTRTSNGIRTYSAATGQSIDFRRLNGPGGNWPGNGGGNNGGWDGPTSNPPNWAQGSFISYNPAAEITIERNGRVTSYVNGRSYRGRYYNGAIYSEDGGVATLTRDGNGFRTYDQSTGVSFTFRRR